MSVPTPAAAGAAAGAAAARPRIALLCATQRGVRVLRRLIELAPHAELLVCSFPEEGDEPRFLAAVRELAEAHGARFVETRNVGSARLEPLWRDTPPDLLLAVSWRYLVPRGVYERATRGAFVFHDSLLPRYRGFAPTVWAIVNGEDHTGVTLFEMVDAVDAGRIVDQRRVPIGDDDAIPDVLERVTEVYVELLAANLDALLAGTAPRVPQDESCATYTCRRAADDNRIDWRASTRAIHDLVRAVTRPYPGAFTSLDGRRLRVWSAAPLPDAPRYVGRVPGRVVAADGDAVHVLTGDGLLVVREVQLDGGEPMPAAALLKPHATTLGT